MGKKGGGKGGRRPENGLPQRTDMHVARKVAHCAMATSLAVGLGFLTEGNSIRLVITGAVVMCSVLEAVRQHVPLVNGILQVVLGPLMRSHEVKKTAGTFYYAVGCWLAVVLFPKPVAVHALLCLGWVDPVASVGGILFRSVAPVGNGKSWCGFALGGLVIGIVGFAYLHYAFPSETTDELAYVAAVVALFAAFVEAIIPSPPAGPFPFNTDDNFVIPVACALFINIIYGSSGLLGAANSLHLSA
mmetsp:Transcript_35276/g.99453  ORF Transcript_35276/g.99453 Transcript_35276/m.99453 type:complete len:245 (+) Transcript_35276:15-749(+)|eukprot:CAMPEP_0119122488 /NCGR_PEP_ID=MMETSP1310-20130426/2728_1 /TAXON_ID=464262 /ORGANISM="Genus nov. species nov., Strain RCC2339" /LENGTH=244 /DNA_ID=CAMNT_0007112147 /DNA_START=69 /DNA_END=803 /DNA_ORIENTATION=+